MEDKTMNKKLNNIKRAEIIEFVIKEERTYYKDKYGLRAFKEINHGYCMYFAESVQFILQNDYGIDVEIIDSDTLKNNPEDGDNSDWSKEAFEKRNFKFSKRISFDESENIMFGYHVWIYDKELGKHYDSESPKGVLNVLSLPIYKRAVTRYLNIKDFLNY